MAPLTPRQEDLMYEAYTLKEQYAKNPTPLTTSQSYSKHLGDVVDIAWKGNVPFTEVAKKGIDTRIATQLHAERRPPEEIQKAIVEKSPSAEQFSTLDKKYDYAKEVEREAYRQYTQEKNQRPERSQYQTSVTHASELAKRELELRQMQQHLDRER